jgi:hypothetical protein
VISPCLTTRVGGIYLAVRKRVHEGVVSEKRGRRDLQGAREFFDALKGRVARASLNIGYVSGGANPRDWPIPPAKYLICFATVLRLCRNGF